MILEVGRRFEHGPFECHVIERHGGVILAKGRIFATSPATWFVGRVVAVPTTWRRDIWPWRLELAHERLPKAGERQELFGFSHEDAARETFQRLGEVS